MAGSGGGGTISAAGAVVSRGDGGEVEVALVHRPRYDDWSLPKGKLEPGEHVLHAAVREVVEETGLRVVLGRTLPASTYEVVGGVKRVSYWAARCAGSEQFVPGPEVDQMAWLELGAARERLSYERDRVILDAFAARPAVTSPLILLRHAEAGQKLLTGEQNLARPLDARGVADAQVLADLLACYGRCRVLSSAAERCIATVRPYAAAVGSRIEVNPALTVPADGRADVVPELAARLAVSGEPALVCAHRENLPPLIRAAFAALGAEPPQEPPLAKGAFWVLQAADGTLASAERHDVETLAPGCSTSSTRLATHGHAADRRACAVANGLIPSQRCIARRAAVDPISSTSPERTAAASV